jgi:hypothetical protein
LFPQPLVALIIINYYPGVWFLDPIAAIGMSVYMVRRECSACVREYVYMVRSDEQAHVCAWSTVGMPVVHKAAHMTASRHESWLFNLLARLLSCRRIPAPRLSLQVWMWADAAKTQIFLLSGQAANADEIGQITFLALTHSPSILAVDTVLACECGVWCVVCGVCV